jgi:prepilin-type N-terminal cleavage/methylation domain-containing protein
MRYFLVLAIKSQRNKVTGFTLIELLVVVILLGIFAALGLPMLLGQIAKGRQAEARASLGTISRAQQAYRYENAIFASLSQLPIQIQGAKFYTFADTAGTTPDVFGAAYQANAVTEFGGDIKNYAGASGQTASGLFTGIVCEDETPLEDNVSTTNSSGNLNCVNGIRIN